MYKLEDEAWREEKQDGYREGGSAAAALPFVGQDFP